MPFDPSYSTTHQVLDPPFKGKKQRVRAFMKGKILGVEESQGVEAMSY